jgi:hypothetical protein
MGPAPTPCAVGAVAILKKEKGVATSERGAPVRPAGVQGGDKSTSPESVSAGVRRQGPLVAGRWSVSQRSAGRRGGLDALLVHRRRGRTNRRQLDCSQLVTKSLGMVAGPPLHRPDWSRKGLARVLCRHKADQTPRHGPTRPGTSNHCGWLEPWTVQHNRASAAIEHHRFLTTQNPVPFTRRAGSTPASGTKSTCK